MHLFLIQNFLLVVVVSSGGFVDVVVLVVVQRLHGLVNGIESMSITCGSDKFVIKNSFKKKIGFC